MSDRLLTVPIEADVGKLEDKTYERIRAVWSNWEPATFNLEVPMISGFASQYADLAEAAGDVMTAILETLGKKIHQLPPILATSATAATTWTMTDALGYTIPAGTQVQIAASGSDAYAFEVLEEVQVPVGSTETELGEVILVASIPGSAPNGLEADPTLISALNFVATDGITLESAVAGGVDDEDVETYLGRLVALLELQSPRPILAADVAKLARSVPGVYRAVAIDNYDPETETFDNEKMTAVAAVDEDGIDVAAPIKTAIGEMLAAMRETQWILNVIDTVYGSIDVDAEVGILEGFDEATVLASVSAALETYLSPANAGGSSTSGDPRAWRNVDRIRLNEVISLIDRVPGVDWVGVVELNGDTDDIVFAGPVTLPEAGTITPTAA